MSEYLLPTLTVLAPLLVATVVSYLMLINNDPHSRHRR